MPLAPNSRLGNYEILGPLGAGGMGEVYRAKDPRLGREIAIKVLPAEVASSPDRLVRFEREARTVAGLNHPNIVVLYTVEDAEGTRFLTMELVEGQTLSTVVSPGGLPLQKLLELAIPLTDALAAAHEKGVIHRDLKPGNVMVTREGRVKVLDFGLAKLVESESAAYDETLAATAESPISREGKVVGTVPYMAPEQLRGEAVDARCDLFSLGIILYELATGRRPFQGDSSAEITSSILRDAPEPLSRVRKDLPGDLERLIGHCLEKSPRERVQTALDVNSALRRLRKTLERGEREKPASDQVASIAVLPFVNRSRDEEDEYFSDGLADELLNVLSKIKGLHVSARASSFYFKGKDLPLAEVGKALNVTTVLDGSVRKAGHRVRISVQLVKVADGYHLWSETYDRALDDIFAVQDDIAQSVVKELRTALLGEEPGSDASNDAKAEVASATRGRKPSAEAYRLYLQGRYFSGRRAKENIDKAIGYFQEALQLEPAYALAWVGLAEACVSAGGAGWIPREEAYGRARDASEKALALDSDLAEAYAVLGAIHTAYDQNWRRAEAMFRTALALAPSNSRVLSGAGKLAHCVGRVDEAIAHYRRALEQDPLSPTIHQSLALALFTVGRHGEAETMFRKALELAPEQISTRADFSLTLLALGRTEEALAVAGQEPHEAFRLWALAMIHHARGRAAESDQALRELTERHTGNAEYQIAEAHAFRGEPDLAFEWLRKTWEQRDPGIVEALASPQLRSLHSDPRWGAFLRSSGLEG